MSESTPYVSVVIPCYNQGSFLRDAVDSVMHQTVSSVQCMVVDDGSNDETADVLRGLVRDFGPERVLALQHDGGVNRGVCASRNLALSRAKGRYIAFLDADDAWLSHKLERQLAVFERFPEVTLVYGSVLSVPHDEWGGGQSRNGQGWEKWGTAPDAACIPFCPLPSLLKNNYIPSPTPLIKSERICDLEFEVGRHCRDRKIQVEDHLMWLKLGLRGAFVFIDEPLAVYRLHHGQASGRFTRGLDAVGLLTAFDETYALYARDPLYCQHSGLEAAMRSEMSQLLGKYMTGVPLSEILAVGRIAMRWGMGSAYFSTTEKRVAAACRRRWAFSHRFSKSG